MRPDFGDDADHDQSPDDELSVGLDDDDLDGDDLDGDDLDDDDLDDDQEIAEDLGARELRTRDRQGSVAGLVLSVVAVALCVIGPFLTLYGLHIDGDADRALYSGLSYDGWGRYHPDSALHGPLYGIGVTAAAVLILAAAAARARNAGLPGMPAPPGSAAEPARSLAVAGSALLLGVWVSIALAVQSAGDNLDQQSVDASLRLGAGLWVLLAAWVVSALAVAVPEYLRQVPVATADY